MEPLSIQCLRDHIPDGIFFHLISQPAPAAKVATAAPSKMYILTG
jgi:hypothetical protein